jgi:D-alanine-D-alanine ligase-like ATP-grasp enzyme
LLASLKSLSETVWQTFGLAGYARIDYRVDDEGVPCILEINTNPCLSPDAGFAAALAVGGIDFVTAMDRIIAHAMNSQVGGKTLAAHWDKNSGESLVEEVAVRRVK